MFIAFKKKKDHYPYAGRISHKKRQTLLNKNSQSLHELCISSVSVASKAHKDYNYSAEDLHLEESQCISIESQENVPD